jgi:16S rRNA (guanine527-N7)-methyltransferase
MSVVGKMETEQFEKIKLFSDLLIKWTAKINLIGRASVSEIMERHVLDCLQLTEYLPNKHATIADLGTGAGFPGIILAINGYDKLALLEVDQKKCVFLREARRLLGLDFEIIESRIEDITDRKFEIIVSRALASLDNLLGLSLAFLNENSKCVFMKGVSFMDEIKVAQQKWDFQYIAHDSKTSCGGVILEVHNIRRK